MTKSTSWKRTLIKWSKELVSIFILLSLVSLALDWYRSINMPSGEAPVVQAVSIDNIPIDIIEQSHEAPVVLYFWATWCGACKFVSPTIDWFSNHYQVVSVALSSGPDQRVRQYMEAKDYQFPVINDTTGVISRQWNITVTPTIAIINNGQIENISTGVTTPMGLWLRLLSAQ
ncbi:protein disulfide oxidoreductase [Vibrio sp. 10N]|uniref:protein disulfide oxidoreductase n=1 Tax=Vibrio sp. 10N TaxID=3058938 RepID=UPI0028129CE0|nr:protein disulfide oxidoreductase [Vibrio sp. 10N]